jgi:heat shock protein HslJ/membrane-bound inhibitor of C-type lysozyme
MIRFLALALGLVVAAGVPSLGQAGDMRAVTGALTYTQKIALPPDARAIVQAQGRFGVMLGDVAIEADGHQMPRGFALDVPVGLSGTVRALIEVNGAPRWIVEGVGFDAGAALVDLGELDLAPVTPLAFATDFLCGDTAVSVGMLGDEVMLRAEGRDIAMTQVRAASGARYEAMDTPDTSVWNKGDAAMIRLNGQDLPECREIPPPAERPYRARGNEPGWQVSLAAGIAMIEADYGVLSHEVPRPDAQAVPGAYEFTMPEAKARLRIEERLCHDDMTGMPYPDTAQLALDGRVLRGCGGDPADLLTGATWQVTALGGATLIEPERLSLNFLDAGRVAGSSGCNRIIGGFTLTGEGLQFGPMASTMMACPDPLMEQERRMLDALEQVAAFDVGADGTLRLLGDDHRTALIEATRP